jgi:hypothetical protein
MSTKITDDFFEYGSLKYFRGNAHLLEICSYGEKKDPVGSKSYIDPQAKIKREHIAGKISKGLTVTIDWSQSSQAEVEVNGALKVFNVGVTAATSYTYSKVKSAKVKLYNLSINEGPLKTLLNTDADGARKFMAEEGNDARTVSEVWVVMEAELATAFSTATSVSSSVNASAQLSVTASGGNGGTQTITLSPGCVFAYKTHKVKEWNKDKTKVEDLEADYHN